MRLISVGATALALIGSAVAWEGSARATVYHLVGQNISPATATGTITTDGATGMLSQSDILGFDITVADGNNSAELTESNANLLSYGGLSATASGLYFDFGANYDYIFNVENSLTSYSEYCLGAQGTYCDNYAGNEQLEVAGVDYEGPVQNANVEIAASVPEPATWATLLIGFAGLGWAGYRRAGLKIAAA